MGDMPAAGANVADFIFRAQADLGAELLVTAFRGEEGISELFRFEVDLSWEAGEIPLQTLVGQPAVLEIVGTAGTRFVNGIIRRFARTGDTIMRTLPGRGASRGLTNYTAEIVPVHWLLTRRHASRIFQVHNCPDMTVAGIIGKVFEQAGIADDQFRFALTAQYQPREYVVQYRETDFDFISRLMEHEGIFYFFEHTAAGHTMVIGDSRVAHPVMPLAGAYAFRDPDGFVQERESIFRLLSREQIETGAVCLDDFDFKRPPFDLKTERTAEVHSAREYSDYPGNYVDKAVGQRYANIRLEERQVQRRGIEMAASVRSFLPGYTFVLNHHPAVAGELLVTHLTHRATQPQGIEQEGQAADPPMYEVNVRAIAADVPFRPPAKTPRPTVQGSQTAFGARHVEQALLRLKPGGRLVAIVGRGMALERPTPEWPVKGRTLHGLRTTFRRHRQYQTVVQKCVHGILCQRLHQVFEPSVRVASCKGGSQPGHPAGIHIEEVQFMPNARLPRLPCTTCGRHRSIRVCGLSVVERVRRKCAACGCRRGHVLVLLRALNT